MKEEFKKALDGAFSSYGDPSALGWLKAEMAEVLEDRFMDLRKRGVIEEAAIKKVLSELERTVKNAERVSGGNKRKRLERIAKDLGVSPIGRRLGLLQLAAVVSAGFGLLAAAIIWITGGNTAGALGAASPFAAASAALFIYVRTRRPRF